MVNIHSKVIVIDPFGENPVVMTGSHNLGFKASSANDDNLVIIEGNPPLAAAYAVNIVAIFQTYRWNNYVEAHRKDPTVWHGLVDNDTWQDSHLTGSELVELKFWLGEKPASVPTKSAAQAAAATPAPVPPKSPHRANVVSTKDEVTKKAAGAAATASAHSAGAKKNLLAKHAASGNRK